MQSISRARPLKKAIAIVCVPTVYIHVVGCGIVEVSPEHEFFVVVVGETDRALVAGNLEGRELFSARETLAGLVHLTVSSVSQ